MQQMIKISNIKSNPEDGIKSLTKKAAVRLKIKEAGITKLTILRRSIDARKKDKIKIIYTVCVSVENEKKLLSRIKDREIELYQETAYQLPQSGKEVLCERPVVVGMGPCGLFCAYMLAKAGYSPLVLERGEAVDARREKVAQFWQTGELDPESNVQFGEGGAGTFSDGKLNTQVKDPSGRIRHVLETFVAHGAKEEILYDSKPHIGTDVLSAVIKSMREEILSLGGEIRFCTKLTGLHTDRGCLAAIEVNEQEKIPVQALVLAPGHSARDTFDMLLAQKIQMEPKASAVGLRVQHPQAMIDELQYGTKNHPALGAASYKVAAKTSAGRNVYSFCMCPGGYVVNASSEPFRTAVNGMSYSGRNGKNANSAIVIAVTPEDYKRETGREDPLCGIAFQQQLEEKAYRAGDGALPLQLFGDFEAGKESTAFGEILPEVKGSYRFGRLDQIFPKEICDSFIEGMHRFGYNLEGFDRPDTVLCAVESRTSSPVRIVRNEEGTGSIDGLYPAGEGAGYAGGITSAALDGIRTAEKLIQRYVPSGRTETEKR